jgi:hypothetical protein
MVVVFFDMQGFVIDGITKRGTIASSDAYAAILHRLKGHIKLVGNA